MRGFATAHDQCLTVVGASFAGGGIYDFVKVPGTSGSYWGAAGVEKSASSATHHPAMVIYGAGSVMKFGA